MKKYRCTVCDWIYDPAVGDPEGGTAGVYFLILSAMMSPPMIRTHPR